MCQSVANCSERTANQNANIEAKFCKIARKRTLGLTVILARKRGILILCELVFGCYGITYFTLYIVYYIDSIL